jgi:hypothetical protein
MELARKKSLLFPAGFSLFLVPREKIELPTRGFSGQIFLNSKISLFQAVDSIPFFQPTVGFVWNHLKILDLAGHNLGTIQKIHI